MSKTLREFQDTDVDTGGPDTNGPGADTGSASFARTSRSDEGILALANSVFQHIFGLDDETRSRMLKIIRNQGQWMALKNSVRQLSGVAHRRLNDVVNMSQDANPATAPEEHLRFNPDANPGELDREGHGHQGRAVRQEFEEVRENKMSFAGYLLNEVTYDDDDLRDPQKKQDIMRMMRAGDSQAEQLKNRADREQKQERRQEVAKEQDPQRAQLLRKRQNLMQQITRIDQQLEQGTQQQGNM